MGFNAIKDVQSSCFKFRPATTADKDWVMIEMKEPDTCSATLGYRGPGYGAHTINLGRSAKCATKSTVIHELLHIMGVQHEQNRPDRDDYITFTGKNFRFKT